MRLLHTKTLRLSEFWGKSLPRYAILSHTWEDEEVTFQDVQHEKAGLKKGFLKIVRCCEEAHKDDIDYAWIDTCCIDKTSSSELSEAINSMFQWYSGAVKCYAYLSDLPSRLSEEDTATKLPDCRWFTRGWTLQELLAPREVVLFDRDWTRIGDRKRWATVISSATSIHEEALTGNVHIIRSFSVAQKFSWASNRSTTREEDIAYCMLGLFNVQMPLLYGEGSRAFIRLQEEIMKKSDDQSIFAWSGFEHRSQLHGLLADSPGQFARCDKISPFRNWKLSEPYEMTNAGLRMRTSLLQGRHNSEVSLILQCYDQDAPERLLGFPLVPLSQDGGDQYARAVGELEYHTGQGCNFFPMRTIYIRNDIIAPELHVLNTTGKTISFQISAGVHNSPFSIKDAWPRSQWDKTLNAILPPNLSNKMGQESSWDAADPALFNWSWHVALLIDVQLGGDFASYYSNEELFIVVGYNGRIDRCWIAVESSDVDLEEIWTTTPYSGRSEWSGSWDFDDYRSPPVHVALLAPDGGPLSRPITPIWTGRPIQVSISIN